MKGRTRVAARYAKSLLDLALEKGILEPVYYDMQFILNTCQSSRDLVAFLQSPIIKTDKKTAVLKEIFESKINAVTLAFINIITVKKREAYIEEIAESFVNQYKRHKNILTAIVISAVGLDDTLRKQVLELVKKNVNAEVELVEKINKDLIGGFVLRIGDQQVDASIHRMVKDLSRSFSENPYVKQ